MVHSNLLTCLRPPSEANVISFKFEASGRELKKKCRYGTNGFEKRWVYEQESVGYLFI